MKIKEWLSRLASVGRAKKKSDEEIEKLRADFRARYHSFKLLLTANNKALDIMAEMEDALRGECPVGMSFVRSRCTRAAANVYNIVDNINKITLGKYDSLHSRFKEIQQEIDSLLVYPQHDKGQPFVLDLNDIDGSKKNLVGNKMANIGELCNRIRVKTPAGFVVTAGAYWRFMEHNQLQEAIDEIVQSAESDDEDRLHNLSENIQKLVLGSLLPEDIEKRIVEQYRLLEETEGKGPVVMRSSAFGEDLPKTSFAGQHSTEFNVTDENLLLAYKKVVASKYSVQAMTYRLNQGLRDENVAMCVGCMPVVDSVAGGVVYSQNPVDSRDKNIIIHSAPGLPKLVVEGSIASDLFVVSRDTMTIVRKEIRRKERQYKYFSDDGICRIEDTGERGDDPSIHEKQVLELAQKVLSIEKHYDTPQDIEWALDKSGSFVFLQSRPLRQRKSRGAMKETSTIDVDPSTVVLEGGATASPGAAAGSVFVVRTERDVIDFPKGGVLVAAQALPYWAVILSRAKAVVTEQGTIAGHLACVAREFEVPAIMGVKDAIAKLENEGLITVDANKTRIHKGKIDQLLEQTEIPASHLHASPVFESLKRVADKIIHLNLLDPDASDFRPKNCKTFHDITRFCHEKAVKEMFQFGVKRSFPERSSKQLRCDVPMQFWIIDLDDGFAKDRADSKYIQLENIVSIPMLALWRGMISVAWEGPPPVDTRGFLSVLMESAKDPSLVASLPSAYGARNYFMISENFCSLQSRFGYHFCSVEALVGERPSENYIIFQFRGGAASLDRKIRRARLVFELLEEYGFRSSLKQDNVTARIEDYDQEMMESKLEILGYLVFHTRQLDMVMNDESSVRHYKEKIEKDIKELPHRFASQP